MSYYDDPPEPTYLEPPAPRPFDEAERRDALSALLCPYYNSGSGGCNSGCYEEPRCQTDEPEDGWELPTPYGPHILDEFAENERKRLEIERFQEWLDAEKAWLTRDILESTTYRRWWSIPRDIPNGVYPLNPLCARYAKGDRFAVVHNTSGGGSSGSYPTREEAEEELLRSEAWHRNFWEEKVIWRENDDTQTENYRNRGKGHMVLRIGHRHYCPAHLGEDLSTPRSCKGFGGAILRWKFIDGPRKSDEVFASDSVYTQGEIPEAFWDRLPDNAVFVNEKGEPLP